MSLDKVREYLKKYGADDRIIELDDSSATVSLAAKALHCSEAQIAKTLAFTVKDKTIVIVTAGDKKIDNAKFKERFSVKAKMVPFDEVENATGHAAGGVCPFALNDGVEVYLDVSIKEHETVYPACGSCNSAICLTPGEIEEFSGTVSYVDVCKQC